MGSITTFHGIWVTIHFHDIFANPLCTTLGSSPFLEQSVRDLQTRTKTLGEQLNSLQSVSSSVSPIVKNDIFQLNQRLDQLYKSTNQNQRELDNVKQSVNENSAKSKIEKMEIEQNSGMNLKQFEQPYFRIIQSELISTYQ